MPFDQTPGGYPISLGDCCWVSVADSYKVMASDRFPWLGTLDATQQSFAQVFLGVSAQRWDGHFISFGLMNGLIRIDTGGVFEFDCSPLDFFVVGDMVGLAAGNSNGIDFLLPQMVVRVDSADKAIGWVERGLGTKANTVLVRLFDRATFFGVGSNLI